MILWKSHLKNFLGFSPEKEVRLKFAYYITCNEAIKDEKGKLIELRCTYDADTKGGRSEDGRKVRGTLHWVSVKKTLKQK